MFLRFMPGLASPANVLWGLMMSRREWVGVLARAFGGHGRWAYPRLGAFWVEGVHLACNCLAQCCATTQPPRPLRPCTSPRSSSALPDFVGNKSNQRNGLVWVSWGQEGGQQLDQLLSGPQLVLSAEGGDHEVLHRDPRLANGGNTHTHTPPAEPSLGSSPSQRRWAARRRGGAGLHGWLLVGRGGGRI